MQNNRNSFEDSLEKMRRDFEDVMGAIGDFVRTAVEGGGASAASQRMSEAPKRPPVHPRVLADELNRMRERLDDFLDRLAEQLPEDAAAPCVLPAEEPAAAEEPPENKRTSDAADTPAQPPRNVRAEAMRAAVRGMEQAVGGLEAAVDALLDADAAK